MVPSDTKLINCKTTSKYQIFVDDIVNHEQCAQDTYQVCVYLKAKKTEKRGLR